MQNADSSMSAFMEGYKWSIFKNMNMIELAKFHMCN